MAPTSDNAERIVPLTIRVIGLPSGTFEDFSEIRVGIQHGKTEVQAPTKLARDEAEFSFSVRAKATSDSRSVNFLGPYAQGPPSARFVYLSWSGVVGGKRKMFRRIKVHLNSISAIQVQRAISGRGRLEARISGYAPDGGPACATVPLLGRGWVVVP